MPASGMILLSLKLIIPPAHSGSCCRTDWDRPPTRLRSGSSDPFFLARRCTWKLMCFIHYCMNVLTVLCLPTLRGKELPQPVRLQSHRLSGRDLYKIRIISFKKSEKIIVFQIKMQQKSVTTKPNYGKSIEINDHPYLTLRNSDPKHRFKR